MYYISVPEKHEETNSETVVNSEVAVKKEGKGEVMKESTTQREILSGTTVEREQTNEDSKTDMGKQNSMLSVDMVANEQKGTDVKQRRNKGEKNAQSKPLLGCEQKIIQENQEENESEKPADSEMALKRKRDCEMMHDGRTQAEVPHEIAVTEDQTKLDKEKQKGNETNQLSAISVSQSKQKSIIEDALVQRLRHYLESNPGSHLISRIASIDEIHALTSQIKVISSTKHFKWSRFLNLHSNVFNVSTRGELSVSLLNASQTLAVCPRETGTTIKVTDNPRPSTQPYCKPSVAPLKEVNFLARVKHASQPEHSYDGKSNQKTLVNQVNLISNSLDKEKERFKQQTTLHPSLLLDSKPKQETQQKKESVDCYESSQKQAPSKEKKKENKETENLLQDSQSLEGSKEKVLSKTEENADQCSRLQSKIHVQIFQVETTKNQEHIKNEKRVCLEPLIENKQEDTTSQKHAKKDSVPDEVLENQQKGSVKKQEQDKSEKAAHSDCLPETDCYSVPEKHEETNSETVVNSEMEGNGEVMNESTTQREILSGTTVEREQTNKDSKTNMGKQNSMLSFDMVANEQKDTEVKRQQNIGEKNAQSKTLLWCEHNIIQGNQNENKSERPMNSEMALNRKGDCKMMQDSRNQAEAPYEMAVKKDQTKIDKEKQKENETNQLSAISMSQSKQKSIVEDALVQRLRHHLESNPGSHLISGIASIDEVLALTNALKVISSAKHFKWRRFLNQHSNIFNVSTKGELSVSLLTASQTQAMCPRETGIAIEATDNPRPSTQPHSGRPVAPLKETDSLAGVKQTLKLKQSVHLKSDRNSLINQMANSEYKEEETKQQSKPKGSQLSDTKAKQDLQEKKTVTGVYESTRKEKRKKKNKKKKEILSPDSQKGVDLMKKQNQKKGEKYALSGTVQEIEHKSISEEGNGSETKTTDRKKEKEKENSEFFYVSGKNEQEAIAKKQEQKMNGKMRPTASSATDQDFSVKKLSIVPEERSREGPSAEIETDLQRDKHCESQYYELAEHELKNALIDVFVATNNRPLSLDQIRNDPPYSLQLIITKLKLKKQIVLWPYFLKAHHDTFRLKEKEFNLLNSFYEKARRENCIRSATFDYSQVSPANKFAMHPNVRQTVKEQSNKDKKKEEKKESPMGCVFLPESEQKGQEKKQEEQKVVQSETMKQCKQKKISKQQEEKKNENPEKSKKAVKRKEKCIRLLESHLKQSLCDFLARNPGSHLISKVANVDEVRAARNDLETRTSHRLRWRPFFKKHSDTFVISGLDNPGLESVSLCRTASLSKLFVENSQKDTRQKQVESKNEKPKLLKESSVQIVQKTKTQKQENEISALPEVISEHKQKGLVNKQGSEKGGKPGNSEILRETEYKGIPNEKQEETKIEKTVKSEIFVKNKGKCEATSKTKTEASSGTAVKKEQSNKDKKKENPVLPVILPENERIGTEKKQEQEVVQSETLQRKEKNIPKQQEEQKIPENSEIALKSKERRIKLLESQLKQILFNFLANDSGSHLLCKVANVDEIRAITNALGTLASQRFKWKPFLKKQSDTFVISGSGNPGLESVSLYGTASGSTQCLQSGVIRVNEISSTDLRPDAFKLFEELGQICTSMGFSKPVKISTEELCGAFATVVSLNERTIGSSVNVDLNCSQVEALKCALEWLTGLTT